MSKIISLSREIYSDWVIAQALKDYTALASIETHTEENRTICRFSRCKYDEELTTNEFLNYLVDLLNSTAYA